MEQVLLSYRCVFGNLLKLKKKGLGISGHAILLRHDAMTEAAFIMLCVPAITIIALSIVYI